MNTKRPPSWQPIPKNAKRVFRGKLFDVYQWEQKMYDGHNKIFEKVKRPDTVNILPVTSDGKILLSKQEQPDGRPFLGTVGGRIDEGENPLEAAKRELLEETGFKADEFILWDAIQISGKVDWACYTFIAKGCHKVKGQKVDSGEKINLITFSFDEFLKLAAQDDFRDTEIVLKLFREAQNPKKLEKTKRLFTS
ncbi:MAG: NUDIX hydrolase [Patescibacteria group bacterium]